MSAQLNRSVELLFESDARPRDIKFFAHPDSTVESLAEQVIRGFAALEDESSIIVDVDQGLTK